MVKIGNSRFQRVALASGLVSVEQLRAADAAVRKGDRRIGTLDDAPDEQLAHQLVKAGVVNAWQVGQLKDGRSKFNLGPYQVIDSIGQGGMGQVFKGVHTMMGRTVAIKVLPRDRSTPEAINCFAREIRAQAQLDHHHLVRAFDAGHEGKRYFLVCEYVPGADLRRLVRSRGKLSMHDAATIISQAADGLSHAHQRGLIHRDVKPGNLLVTPEGFTKVSDLGLAGYLDASMDDQEPDPRAGKIVGTADYLAPEQVLTPNNVTPAADVYALGATLYYAVTGKVPFAGGTPRDKARRHVDDTPLNPKRLNPDLADEFVAVIAAMMEKNPADRLTTAEVIRRLSPWARVSLSPSLGDAIREGNDSRQLVSGPFGPNLAPGAGAGFLGDAVEPSEESPSQVSQATDPVSAALEETLPGYQVKRVRPAREKRSSRAVLLVALVLAPVMLAAGLLLTLLALEALR
jgi:serine/threonine protein kinase